MPRGRQPRHGHAARNTTTPVYSAWVGMKARCYNRRCKCFPRYGGRGIRVCQRWLDRFEDFLADMGQKPSPQHSIERIDNNGDYTPNNCRWATAGEQQQNRRCARMLTVGDETKPLNAWAKQAGISHWTVRTRLRQGWDPLKAVTTPPLIDRRT